MHPQGHDNRYTSKDKLKNGKNIKCFHYNRMDHMKKQWRFLKSEHNQGSKDEKVTNKVGTDDEITIVCDDSYVSLVRKEVDLVIDSGASFHVTSYSDLFTSYSRGDYCNIKMRNCGAFKIVTLEIFGWRLILEANYCSKMLGIFHICS